MPSTGTPMKCLRRAAVPIVLALTAFLLIQHFVGNGVDLRAHVEDVSVSGPNQVKVAWLIDNQGSNDAFFHHCTISVTTAEGTIVGRVKGGPFPPQVTRGPLAGGNSWHTTTIVATMGDSSIATHAKVTCTGAVNAGK